MYGIAYDDSIAYQTMTKGLRLRWRRPRKRKSIEPVKATVLNSDTTMAADGDERAEHAGLPSARAKAGQVPSTIKSGAQPHNEMTTRDQLISGSLRKWMEAYSTEACTGRWQAQAPSCMRLRSVGPPTIIGHALRKGG